ncbi:TPA: outer membrane beta-barrel protein [Elizabethkingia anophelis]
MNKKLFKFFCISLLPIGTSLIAQHKLRIGLDAGYTYNVITSNLSGTVDSKYSARYGAGANLHLEYNIWKNIFVSTGVSFVQKNYNFERTGSRAGWYTQFTNDFLSFPLLVGIYAFGEPSQKNGLWIKLAGGMYNEYWLRMKREGRYPSFMGSDIEVGLDKITDIIEYDKVTSNYDFKKNENQLNRWGYGMQGQAQVGYSFNKYMVDLSYNYMYGLSDINKVESNKKMSLRTYMLSLGISYNID